MQRIIFVTIVLLLAFQNLVHSAVVPSYEGWEAAEEVQVRKLVGALLHEETLRPAHFAGRTTALKIVPSQIGPGSFYHANTLYIGTRPHAGTGNEWFNHSTVHEYSHALTDFSGDGNLQFPLEFYEALAETYTQYIAPRHLARVLKPARSRLGGIRQSFNFLPEKPDLAFRETVWQQNETHSCIAGDCESSYSELSYVLYRLVSVASIQLTIEDRETFYRLTRSLHEQWMRGNKQRLQYDSIYEALNRAFTGVNIDGHTPGNWLATRRTFSQVKTGQLASIEAMGADWNGSRLLVGPFNPSMWMLRLFEGIAPRHIKSPVRLSPLSGGPFEIVVTNAFGAPVLSLKTSVVKTNKGQISSQLPPIVEPGLYRISVYQAGNANSITRGYFMVVNSPGDELVSNSRFVWSVSPQGDINSQPPQINGCDIVWSVNGLSKLDNCTGSKVYVSGEEFSLDAKRRILVTNGASHWPVLQTDPQKVVLTRAKKRTQIHVYNTNPQAQDTSFRMRVTHDSGTLDQNWCSAQLAQGIEISASPNGAEYPRQCEVCLESMLGSSTACVAVTYNPF